MKKRIASAVLALCLVLALLPTTALAADTGTSGDCGTNLTWVLDSDGVLTISGTGSMTSWLHPSLSAPWYSHRDEITSVVINEGVTSIGDKAFQNCTHLSSVTIPSSVTMIRNSADSSPFGGCSELTRIDVAPGNKNYSSEDGVLFAANNTVLLRYPAGKDTTSYSIPDGVRCIDDEAFEDSSKLTSITIPNSVITIDEQAFIRCFGLTSITIPYGVTRIDDYAFAACEGLTSVTIPDSVQHIGYSAFSNCHSLTSATILNGLETISSNAFRTCERLTSVTIPKSVTCVLEDAFSFCDALTDVYYGGSEEDWNKISFWGNSALTNATIHYNSPMPPSTSFTITFDANGGVFSTAPEPSASDPKIIQLHTNADGRLIDDAGNPNQPPIAVNQYYIFDGWYTQPKDGDKLEDPLVFKETTTVYAHWTPVVITFDANEGEFANHKDTTTMSVNSEGRLVWPANPTRTGYTFAGWYDAAENGNKVTTDTVFTKDSIIYAHWTQDSGTTDPDDPKTFTVAFDLNYTGATGAPEAMTTGTDGKLAALPANPTRDGYTFADWYDAAEGGNKITTDTVFTENDTVYAHWTQNTGTDDPKTYTITFNANGGEGNPVEASTGTDGKVAVWPKNPTRTGYTFDGWFTAATGGTAVPSSTVFTEDTIVYAHWTEEPSTPSTTRYPIYWSSSVSGGRVYVSHSYAAQGTRVTIEISPRSNYELDYLSVINLDTGRSVRLTEYDWDEYTFVMPDSAVDIEVSFDSIDSLDRYGRGSYFILPEPQIPTGPNAWYYRDRHIYHINSGLVPDGTPITRDMFLSVLYNLTNNRTSDSTAVGSETNDAQSWATSHNIVPDIYASGLWGPDKSLSREQAAMLIFGYAGYRNYSTSQGSNLTRYIDYNQIRPIARTAMSWVVATNLLPSTTAVTLSPLEVLTCGQAGNLIFQFQTNVARNFSYY